MAKAKKAATKKKSMAAAKKTLNKRADKREAEKHATTKNAVKSALDKRNLQKRNGDTIVYVRMKPEMFAVFEEAYARHCEENMLNPASYGMSSFVRENAFSNLKANGQV